MFNEENLAHYSLEDQIAIMEGALSDPSPWHERAKAQEYLEYLYSVRDTWYDKAG